MSSQGTSQPQWLWDHAAQQYYWYDFRAEERVYQDGRRVPRSSVPRTTGLQPQPQQQPPQQQHQQRQQQQRHQSPPPRSSTSAGGDVQSISSSSPQGYRLSTVSSRSRTDSSSAASQVAATQATPASLSEAIGRVNLNAAPTISTTVRNGITFIDASNPDSRVRNLIGTSPPERITDPALLQQNIQAHRYLAGTGGEAEVLYPNYRVRPHSFFCLGRVFLMLWAEPMGETGSVITSLESADPNVVRGRMGERVYSKVRRFVVVRESSNYCSTLPIATYGSQGVGKTGVVKSEHAIIHTGRDAPSPRPSEAPARGELPMRSRPIRVVPDDPREPLDPLSRLDFGKIHTVQHNVKARNMGMVHPDSMSALTSQFDSVWRSQSRAPSSSSAIPRTAAAPPPASTASASRATPRVPDQKARSRRDDEESDDDEDDDDESGDDEAEAERAGQAQRAYHRMTGREGMSPEQAVERLISSLRDHGFSRAGAEAEIRARLRYRRRDPDS